MTELEARRILAVDPQATLTEVRQAYLDMVKVWHPDRFEHDPRLRGKAVRTLQEVNDAWAVLQQAASRPASQSAASSSSSWSPPASQTTTRQEASPQYERAARAESAASEGGAPVRESVWMSRQNIMAGGVAVIAGISLGVFLVNRSLAPVNPSPDPVVPLSQAVAGRDAQPAAVNDSSVPKSVPSARTNNPRPESGTDLRTPTARGRGVLSIVNSEGADALVSFEGAADRTRLIYLRRGEKVTLLDVATGDYTVRAILGRTWDGHAFATPSAHYERTSPLTVVDGGGAAPPAVTLSLAAGEFRVTHPFTVD